MKRRKEESEYNFGFVMAWSVMVLPYLLGIAGIAFLFSEDFPRLLSSEMALGLVLGCFFVVSAAERVSSAASSAANLIVAFFPLGFWWLIQPLFEPSGYLWLLHVPALFVLLQAFTLFLLNALTKELGRRGRASRAFWSAIILVGASLLCLASWLGVGSLIAGLSAG